MAGYQTIVRPVIDFDIRPDAVYIKSQVSVQIPYSENLSFYETYLSYKLYAVQKPLECIFSAVEVGGISQNFIIKVLLVDYGLLISVA